MLNNSAAANIPQDTSRSKGHAGGDTCSESRAQKVANCSTAVRYSFLSARWRSDSIAITANDVVSPVLHTLSEEVDVDSVIAACASAVTAQWSSVVFLPHLTETDRHYQITFLLLTEATPSAFKHVDSQCALVTSAEF